MPHALSSTRFGRLGRRSLSLMAAASALVCIPAIYGQAAASAPLPSSAPPPPPAAEAVPEEQTVVLDPFEVQSTADTGYVAQNTMSGTRLNSSLKDTPMSVSVFTQQFMEDIDATNIAQVAQYAPNVSVDFGLTGNNSAGNNLATGDTTFHVRGIPTDVNGNRLVDLFQYQIEEDAFNTERIEAARGPNTLLYGLGSGAGTFNVVTKRADPDRAFGSATFRFGAYNSDREAVDVNVPIVPKKLAIRINMLDDDEGSWRPNEFNDAKRLAVALRYQISSKWTLDSDYEGGHVNDSVQRPWVSFDSITAWRAAGSPIISTAGSAIPANDGLQAISANTVLIYTTNDGQLYNWQKMSQSQDLGSTTFSLEPMLFDNFKIVPKAATLAGRTDSDEIDYSHVNEFLRGELAPNLFLEFAYDHQRMSFLGKDISAQGDFRVFYDTNAELPTGAPNPYVGQPYVYAGLDDRDRWDFADDYRATLTYQGDFGKIFGHHQLAALAEARSDRNPSSESILENVSSPAVTTAPSNGQNAVFEQTYVNLTGPVANIGLADPALPNGIVNQSSGQRIQMAYVPDTNVTDNRYFQTTASVVLQSSFWNDHLVTTLGYRQDRLDSRLSALEIGAPFGPFQTGNYYAQPTDNVTVLKGDTRTLGGVFNVTSWFGLVYNTADSFTIPDNTITLIPDIQPPAPQGKSEDMGIKLDLLHGQLYATVTYYQTEAHDVSGNLPGGLGIGNPSYINDIWQTLQAAGDLAPNGINYLSVLSSSNGYVYDARSQGWEFELVANPASNIRLYANMAINQTIDSNIGTQYINYIDEYTPLFNKYASVPLSTGATSTVATVGQALGQIQSLIQTNFSDYEGELELGNSKYTANLRAEYTFDTGFLKGAFAGIGDRYRGRPVLGYTTLNPATAQEIETASDNIVDMNVGYERKVRIAGRSLDWKIQLSIANLFDNTDPIITRVFGVAAYAPFTPYSPRSYRLQTPQAWTLSNTFNF